MSRGYVGMGATRQPTNTPDEALIGFLMPNLGRGIIRVEGWSNGVDGNARSVGRGRQGNPARLTREAFYQIGSKSRLVEVNGHRRRSNAPREMNAKELFHNAHKVNLTTF